jgi:hypothetical protein
VRISRCSGGIILIQATDECANKPDDKSYNEPFSLEMACELIGATKQKEGEKVLREEME